MYDSFSEHTKFLFHPDLFGLRPTSFLWPLAKARLLACSIAPFRSLLMKTWPRAVIIVLIAIDKKGNAIGFSFLNLNRPSGDYREADFGIGVIESEQGHGVGSELIRRAVELARHLGVDRICLEVADLNSKAIGLYQKYGFERVGEIQAVRWHSHTYDSIRMWRWLSNRLS
jgi:ribosomal protein S18 acetylase RimI-like enzyme